MKKVGHIQIEMLDKFWHPVEFEGQLMLNDNLNGSGTRRLNDWRNLTGFFPLKFQFTTFLICQSGGATITVDSKEYALSKDKVLLINPNVVVGKFDVGVDFRAALIAFTTDSFISERNDPSIMTIRKNLTAPRVMEFSPREMDLVIDVYTDMRDMISGSLDLRDYRKGALLGSLLLLSALAAVKLDGSADMAIDGAWTKTGVMSKFVEELAAHCVEERSVSYYAGKLSMSPKYFAQRVYKESGRYAKDWIREYVIREAKAMLGSGNYTIKEVSDILRFPNSSFFGKYFKKAVSKSPREYMLSL